jgi:hypothetical protein
MQAERRRVLGAALALFAAGCSAEKEPDEAAIREAIERLHQDWATQRRKDQQAQTPDLFRRLPNVNLAFEADLALRITSVRKIDCKRPPGGELGHVCRAVVGASVAGRAPVLQNIQGRFVRGVNGWTARDVIVLDPAG